MKAYKLTIIILTITIIKGFSQDTIFCDAYPNGVIVSTVDMNNYEEKMNPINNSILNIIIPKNQIIKITNIQGIKYENSDYKKTDGIVVPIEPNTGKINYTGIIEVPEIKKNIIFKALQTLPSGNTQYDLISKDDEEYSFIQYRGKSSTKFAGDQYDVIFSLTIKIKDGKIKYEYHDFMFCFEKIKHKVGFQIGVTSETTNYKKSHVLEKVYVPGYRGDRFWVTIVNNMDESINSLKKTCLSFANDDF